MHATSHPGQLEFRLHQMEDAEFRELISTTIKQRGLIYVLEHISNCREDGFQICWQGIRDTATRVMFDRGQLPEDDGKDQCDKLRKALRALLDEE